MRHYWNLSYSCSYRPNLFRTLSFGSRCRGQYRLGIQWKHIPRQVHRNHSIRVPGWLRICWFLPSFVLCIQKQSNFESWAMIVEHIPRLEAERKPFQLVLKLHLNLSLSCFRKRDHILASTLKLLCNFQWITDYWEWSQRSKRLVMGLASSNIKLV